MELGDETDVFQLRHVMSESKKTVHLYLTVVGEEDEEQAVVNNQFNPTKSNRGRRESQYDGNLSRGRGNDTFVSDNHKEPKVGMTELQRENLFKFGEVPKTGDRRCGEKSNEGWSGDEYTQQKTVFNPWYCIPSIPDCPKPSPEPGPFHCLCPNDKLIINQTYNTKKELAFVVKFIAVREKFQIKIEKSSKCWYQVVCMQENYHWRLYACVIKGT
ncbi:unnamed protein product [Lactuca saligna]|uniref:Transposase MuDR plant domain-containing protein n=1 Tax=Lactuca saligna TaxID=75948 RepID=A0AA36E9W8_LACSI|nr:unnamed protein product [Lactuca saligna]